MSLSDTSDENSVLLSSIENDVHAKLRKLPEKKLEEILKMHQRWLASQDDMESVADLSETDLANVDLSRRDLSYAKLQNAYLKNANLSCSKFKETDLSGADLSGADLTGADLRGANLGGVDLIGADLSGADLRNAKLKGAALNGAILENAQIQGAEYLGLEFAGSDMTGAKLSTENQGFKPLSSVVEISINARRIFFVLLLACVYCWLTIATTADVKLITNSVSSRLPIIETEMPIVPFYFSAPLVLLSVYIYFHFYLHQLWKALAMLPAIFPDSRTLDQQAYPWLVIAIVRRHYSILAQDKSLLARLEVLGTVLLAWWAVPLSLMGFWIRYLPRHDWVGTGLHIGFLAASISLAIIFHLSAKNTISANKAAQSNYRVFQISRSVRYPLYVGICTALIIILSFGAINGVHSKEFDLTDFKITVPLFFRLFRYDVFADLRETDVSSKPADFWRIKNQEDRINSVKGAFLKKADLRYADMFRAFLAKAILRNASMNGARLRKTIFQNADIRGANLDDTDLRGANLKGADLREATLLKADLTGAQLQNANLGLTLLHGANLNEANLENADIRCADLTSVNNLTVDQLAEVKTLYNAKMDQTMLNQIKQSLPHLLEKPATQWVEPNQIKNCP